MRLLIQRVKNANVKVNENIVAEIENGLLVFVGITHNDNRDKADYLVKKLSNLRIFEDENEKMNLSVKDINGEILIVSQFTLYANCQNGNRPSFTGASRPEEANELYEYFCKKCEEESLTIQRGIFGANMQVSLINDGPVTIILEK